jgi:hypothetical protein
MEKLLLNPIDISYVINHMDIDMIVCASGYEKRSSYLARKISSKHIKRKIVLSFSDQKHIQTRIKNDSLFSNMNFLFIESDKDSSEFIIKIINSINEIEKDGTINLLVDYSSMTRAWIATFVNSIRFINKKIKILFSYTLAKFKTPSPLLSPAIGFYPIPGFNNLSIPDKPTALIIGLGYEKNRAAGLIEYFDAEQIFLFHTDNEEYKNHIISANKSIIKQVSNENIIPYPIMDIAFTHTILYNLCLELSEHYRIIIAPCGPKPFSIISFITGIQLGYVDIWRISGENDPQKENRVPSDQTLVFSLEKAITS